MPVLIILGFYLLVVLGLGLKLVLSGGERRGAGLGGLIKRYLRVDLKDERQCLEAFLAGQPDVVCRFFEQDFKPENDTELRLFESVREEILRGETTFDDHHEVFAKIGSPELLVYLHVEHMSSTNEDIAVRKCIAANPRCPYDVILSFLQDASWEVRKAAVLGPRCRKSLCEGFWPTEPVRVVREAMKLRFGFQDDGEPETGGQEV